jgi:hypothetical protein
MDELADSFDRETLAPDFDLKPIRKSRRGADRVAAGALGAEVLSGLHQAGIDPNPVARECTERAI